ncbi:calcium/sodium antiporter [Idiomarina abyssalis]|uniref:Calcium/sodium antiporter n=1 Tax=Idiomarina abyssalis TaxID=86102 RepID=A0A8I1G3N8_9GAMM|nr:calcium/sodium antiporter [Idiomarina abyssalis]MBJ7265320.1 calcium/sodium antiporter [Idiomarina abyssalis]MBJ7274146.1 calcium/sodium antiporter [Idiomarina abyssalis]MBJ7315144.1 calcium/sodium antiporter [Idiomarina abyssalis]
MTLSIVAVVLGLAVLVWSADRFVEGAAAVARHLGMAPLVIGMVIIGFGTSAPEMVVSALASMQGNPALALGNAYGSNITNIALVLGITALLAPIAVKSVVIRREMPVLIAITLLSAVFLLDYQITRLEAVLLLVVFLGYMGWSVWIGSKSSDDSLAAEYTQEIDSHPLPMKPAIIWLIVGLLLLIVSSRALVWGAVNIAVSLGVSDLVIGLTVVAIGTSLPELASAIAATRKNEHDLALGNVIGSNMFNTLAVVGIAGAIEPVSLEPLVLSRDWVAMAILTLLLMVFGIRKARQGRINRVHGVIFICLYLLYTLYLLKTGFIAPQ